MARVITFLSDYGHDDDFVGVCHGVIARIAPDARVIDITQIPNYPPAVRATPTGLNQPNVPFRESDLWLLGGSVGFEVVW